MNIFKSSRFYGYSAIIIGFVGIPAAYIQAGMIHNYSNAFDDYSHQDVNQVNLHDPIRDMIIWVGPVILLVTLLFLIAYKLKTRGSNG